MAGTLAVEKTTNKQLYPNISKTTPAKIPEKSIFDTPSPASAQNSNNPELLEKQNDKKDFIITLLGISSILGTTLHTAKKISTGKLSLLKGIGRIWGFNLIILATCLILKKALANNDKFSSENENNQAQNTTTK